MLVIVDRLQPLERHSQLVQTSLGKSIGCVVQRIHSGTVPMYTDQQSISDASNLGRA